MATIIIQENDSAVLDVLTQALREAGHLPVNLLGPCPLQLSSAIRRHVPELVLVDYRFNSEAGMVLLAAVRRISALLPVVALSCDLNISKVAASLGFSGYLSKPFNLQELFDTVSDALRGKDGRQLSPAH